MKPTIENHNRNTALERPIIIYCAWGLKSIDYSIFVPFTAVRRTVCIYTYPETPKLGFEDWFSRDDAQLTCFSVFDRDGDGFITVNELERALRRHGSNLTRTEINDIMKAADANNDGRIDYDGNVTKLHWLGFNQKRFDAWHSMSLVLRKPAFCICENKDAY